MPRLAMVWKQAFVLLLWSLLTCHLAPTVRGPLEEYDERVHARVLRDDEHQRGMRLLVISVEYTG